MTALGDPSRLAALRWRLLLDTSAEEGFDRVTRLAARLLRAPVALVTLVDADRQFFKSCLGLPEPWASRRETPLSHSFCQHVVASGRPLIVPDAREHPLLRDNLAIPDLGVVAYLGIPLLGSDGSALGTFCVIDHRPRAWSDDEIETMGDLAGAVVTEIELRAAVGEEGRARAELERMAAELDRLRREFVASVSHDLQTPLTAIRAALGLLEAGIGERLPPAERELLATSRFNAERLRVQIDDLLAANQLEAGTLQVQHQPLDLRTVVRGALAVVHPLFTQKGQPVEVDVPGPLPTLGDRRRLEHALVNLLANAHRHTPPGTRVSLDGRAEGDRVLLRVRDDGPGLPLEELELIFRRSYRRGASGGSGLGLTIARAIAERHGGRLWAESRPGEGATFCLALPRDGCRDEGDDTEGADRGG